MKDLYRSNQLLILKMDGINPIELIRRVEKNLPEGIKVTSYNVSCDDLVLWLGSDGVIPIEVIEELEKKVTFKYS